MRRTNKIMQDLTMSLFVFLFYECVATVEILLDKRILDLRDSFALLPFDVFLGASHGE